MRKIILFFLIILFIPKVYAIETSATSVILMDTDNNIILYEKNIHEVRSVASISKIMTALLAVESSHLDDEVVIDDVIKEAYGSAIYIQVGERLTLRDLVYGLMLRSGNDAALAIAKYVGGSVDHFVEMMNNKASEIGMKSTTFNNPHGLDADKGNYSTAYDMAILTSYAMKIDDYKKITSTKKYELKTNKKTYIWKNKNKLLNTYKYTTGGKTGYTEKARRTLVTTASKNNINLVVVTLNDGNDFADHKKLFEYGFNNYTNYTILNKGTINIYDDNFYDEYDLYIKNNFNCLMKNDDSNKVLLKFELEKKRNISNNDNIGKVHVIINDKELYSDDIFVRSKEKNKKNIWQVIKEKFSKIW